MLNINELVASAMTAVQESTVVMDAIAKLEKEMADLNTQLIDNRSNQTVVTEAMDKVNSTIAQLQKLGGNTLGLASKFQQLREAKKSLELNHASLVRAIISVKEEIAMAKRGKVVEEEEVAPARKTGFNTPRLVKAA